MGESDTLLAIGSESFLTYSTANQFNYLNAKMRALETGKTVIRSNKFGPSAVVNGDGRVMEYMPYGETGILMVEF